MSQSNAFNFDPASIWSAMTRTEGVGISVMDRQGGLVFVNETSQGLFFDGPIDYEGKNIQELHPPEFVRERLEMIRRVLDEDRPLVIEHIFHGRPISSAVWPIRDIAPPYQRVLVISRRHPRFEESGCEEPTLQEAGARQIEIFDTAYIELGDLDVLTPKELEVLALIGHGLSVPKVARLLKRSQKTIENHKASITHKLQLKGQSEMVAIVTSLGLDFNDAKRKRMSSAPDRT